MTQKTLGDVADYINGRTFKSDEWEENGLPIIRIQNLTGSTDICNRTTRTYEDKYLVTDGDLLFAWSASLGAHIWHGENGWLNQHIFKVVPHEGTDKQYLYYYLLHVVDQLYAKTHGSGMVHITLKSFKNTGIYMPSRSEQRRVVERIERLFAKLDEAKEKARAVVDGFELRRSAILHKAFTGGLTRRWRQEHPTGEWLASTVGQYTDAQYGYTASAAQEPIGPKFLRITDIQDGTVDWDKVPYCNISKDDFAKYSIKPGDIMVARTGATTGKSYLIGDDRKAVFASYLIRLTMKREGLIAAYLYYFMQSPGYWRQITEFSAGIAQPGVNAKKLQKIELSIPPVEEQREIVFILGKLLRKEQQAKEAAEAVLAQIDAMKKAILARVFRGESGTHGPAEEGVAKLPKLPR